MKKLKKLKEVNKRIDVIISNLEYQYFIAKDGIKDNDVPTSSNLINKFN